MEMQVIKKLKEPFQNSSLDYVEVLDRFSILKNDPTALVLSGFSSEANCTVVHWAANDPQSVVGAIPREGGECLVTFIPRAWVADFEAHGFVLRSVWHDYWKASLDDIRAAGAPEFLSEAEAKAAADVTVACRGQSRGFSGQTPGWIAGWLNGTCDDLIGNDVTDNAILIQRNETRAIVGVVCTGVYAHGSPRGAVAWIREIAVRPDYQRCGIARKLLTQALAYARERGAVRAFLAADECNVHAIHLYESVGFAPDDGDGQIDMLRPVPAAENSL